ncbi:MAG TPA: hypothetical protein VK488_01000 [Gaiellaceae bacterium]|nr:hypothetical protein [Gaiellaceae bacterium]
MPPPTTTTDARYALFAGLIDHAPTFPPAQLPLAAGLAEHRRVRDGDTGWIVNRFVCPASKLRELGDEPLRLSVVVDEGRLPPEDERIEAVEAAGLDPDVLIDAAPEVYCELPLRYDVSFRILQLGELGLRAKVRCGGATTPRIPDLAGFVAACRRLGVPFKATAGLHHPIRSGDEHGFLNLLASVVFEGDEEDALAEEDEAAFAVTAEAFTWRERSAGPEEIAEVRQQLFVGFGSCSAQEPIDGLATLGLLPG